MKIPISFKQSEIDIYEFIKNKRNCSVYIKDLVEDDMKINKGIKKQSMVKLEKPRGNLEIDF